MSRKKKEFKVTISGDKDPELYRWVESLSYGVFSRLVVENLKWMHEKGLLVNGSMASPDILLENQKKPLDMHREIDSDIQEKILIRVEEISALLKSGVVPAASVSHADISVPSTFAEHSEQSFESPLGRDSNDSDDQQAIQAIPTPFKVFRKE
ncbi:hypothetical protein [Acinetobacter sp. P1(2025)]|uniref:hypothetical protein n=1 Tax=Acinetobacter sp. P1(2025) TaxID=3446120 RepID=UPI003F53DC60